MKIVLLILGVILGGIGLVMVSATIIELAEGTSEYSLISDLTYVTTFGIAPIALGTFFIYKALQK